MTPQPAHPERPLPVPDAASQPYWDAARAGRLVLQRCTACRRWVHYPRAVCPHCLAEALGFEEAGGQGTVYSLSVVHRPPAPFAGEEPYIVALIDLDEGVRLLSRLVDCAPEHARIGMRVAVTFMAAAPEVSLPVFRPATPAEGGD